MQLLADQIVENDQRANLSSVELAHAIARMLKGGMNQVEIAAALGRSKQFVSLYAAYGDMPAYLKAALPFAPIRLLYDLHRTARDYPAEVEAYVASWGDAGATLAAGSRFIAELKQTHPAPVPPRAPVAQPLAPPTAIRFDRASRTNPPRRSDLLDYRSWSTASCVAPAGAFGHGDFRGWPRA
ncbi:KorB domain-containing protein [Novosphingobium panipatense]